MKIVITGGSGFIGRALARDLSTDHQVVSVSGTGTDKNKIDVVREQVDLTDLKGVERLCRVYCPDVLIHCAGISHQTFWGNKVDYISVNSIATENLARCAAAVNSDVHFVFLSSVSVYGNGDSGIPVKEKSECHPSCDYAISKFDAENRLVGLHDKGLLKKLDILRLAPVYDVGRLFNIEKRVLSPGKIAYLKFGTGEQQISLLARPNLVEFLRFRLKMVGQEKENTFFSVLNMRDDKNYSFNDIIRILKKSDSLPRLPVVRIPLPLIRLLIQSGGKALKNKRAWLDSCYLKVACSQLYENSKMQQTGSRFRYSLDGLLDNKTVKNNA